MLLIGWLTADLTKNAKSWSLVKENQENQANMDKMGYFSFHFGRILSHSAMNESVQLGFLLESH